MRKKQHKNRKRHFVIKANPYKREILVCLNATNEEAVAIFKRVSGGPMPAGDEEYVIGDKGDGRTGGEVQATMYPLSKGFIVVAKWDDERYRQSLAILIHELSHVAHYVLRSVRVPLSEETEEAYAYLVEDLCRQFMSREAGKMV